MKSPILLVVILIAFSSMQSVSAQKEAKKKLIPTVTIPAPPGPKGFGMPQVPVPGAAATAPPGRRGGSASVTEPREITPRATVLVNHKSGNWKIQEIK